MNPLWRYDFDNNLFEQFWEEYPKRIEKMAAQKAYAFALGSGAKHEEIISGIKNYKLWLVQEGTEPRFIKSPSSWLSKGCWMDDYEIHLPKPEARIQIGETMSQAKARWERDGLKLVK